jgi:acyl-CoA reductase-like NAD-dependent aldehyde dehydrogenase
MGWQGRYDRLFVGGRWTESSGTETLSVTSPFTEQEIATVPSATEEDIDRAIAAARGAFDRGPWPSMTLDDRLAILRRFRELYAECRDMIAELVTQEMGCPITLSRAIQATVPLKILDAYLDTAREFPFEAVRRSASGNALVTRRPVGVVAAVIPWNVPQGVAMQKIAPALVAGCTVVLKPAPETPLDSYLMADLLQQAGVPGGVVNVVPAGTKASEHLVSHPDVDKVTFTGSTAAGRRIAAICGNDLRRVTLELGGKSAAIFLPDTDLDHAVESLRMGSFRNSGQVCSLKTRLVVPRQQEDEILDRLRELVDSMPVGDPGAPDTQIGPVASQRQRARVESYIAAGRDEGATLVAGGGRPGGLDHGWFVAPTVFTGVTPRMRIAQEEIFGPVLSVLTYGTEDEAVAIANDSAYGLNGAVFSGDVERASALARRIRTGTVEINGNPTGFTAPAGGFKASGIGREAGPEGLEAYVEVQALGLPAEYAARLGER